MVRESLPERREGERERETLLILRIYNLPGLVNNSASEGDAKQYSGGKTEERRTICATLGLPKVGEVSTSTFQKGRRELSGTLAPPKRNFLGFTKI